MADVSSPPRVLIDEDHIQARVVDLAAQISAQYQDKGEIVLVGILPDVWTVGYGLDYGEHHRTLPYIGIMETEG